MKIGIYAAGKKSKIIDSNIEFIAVDGGLKTLLSLGITPIVTIGDFDSLTDKELLNDVSTIKLPTMKDLTDTQEAIEYAIAKGYKEIDIYGVTGNRLDHFVACLRMILKYKEVKITIYDNDNKIYLLKRGNHRLYKQGYKYISFYTPSETILTTTGTIYDLDNYLLEYDDTLCTSNEMKDEACNVECNNYLYVIQSN